MSKETKQLLETWRKFIKEGSPDEYGQYSDPDVPAPKGSPVPPDSDLINPDIAEDTLENEDNFYA